jgi:hypothetical protein
MKYLLLLLLMICNSVFAQKKKGAEYYLYKKDWKPAKDLDLAEYVVQLTTVGDSLFVNRVFKGRGHIWKQESFKDFEETIPHGQFAWYDDEGRIDSSGYVNNKKKTGLWSFYDDTLGIYLSIRYDNGKEIERRDYVNKIIRPPEGEKTFDEEKKERDRDSTSATMETFKGVEKGAVFEGGAKGYKKYLEQHLVPPNDIVKTGVVKAQFIVNKIGKVENFFYFAHYS